MYYHNFSSMNKCDYPCTTVHHLSMRIGVHSFTHDYAPFLSNDYMFIMFADRESFSLS